MKSIFFWCLLALVVSVQPSNAEEVGRYQLLDIGGIGSANDIKQVLILDTAKGHFWKWVTIAARPESGQTGGTLLRYEGQVRPGEKAGDIIINRFK